MRPFWIKHPKTRRVVAWLLLPIIPPLWVLQTVWDNRDDFVFTMKKSWGYTKP